MKKQYLIGILTVCVLLVSCVDWMMETPSFVLCQISLKPRSFTEMNLIVALDVQNPNRFDLTLRSFQYTLYLNRKEIGSGRLEKEIMIPSSSTTRIQAPLTANFKNWSESLSAVIAGGDLPYKIEGTAEIKTFFGSVNYPFSKEGKMN
jgi:LEA14-like dessication related protein